MVLAELGRHSQLMSISPPSGNGYDHLQVTPQSGRLETSSNRNPSQPIAISPAQYRTRRRKAYVKEVVLNARFTSHYLLTHDPVSLIKLLCARHIKQRPNWQLMKEGNNSISGTCATEAHTMPYHVARRVLSQIPNSDIQGKKVLDLFSGHGAFSFLLGTGWKGVLPNTLIATDLAYDNTKLFSKFIDPHANWNSWQSIFPTQIQENSLRPNFITVNCGSVPLESGSIDTVFADPPFNYLTKTSDNPATIFNSALTECDRLLADSGSIYALWPFQWMDNIDIPQRLHLETLSSNVGKTWFDIAMLKFTKK